MHGYIYVYRYANNVFIIINIIFLCELLSPCYIIIRTNVLQVNALKP